MTKKAISDWWATLPGVLQGIAAIIAGVAVLLPLLYGIDWRNPPPPPPTWYGYYGDWDPKRVPYVAKEELNLTFEKPVVRGTSEGFVTTSEGPKKIAWNFYGFEVAEYVTLSYMSRSVSDGPGPIGIGSYFLRRSSDGFVGSIITRYMTNVILKCPYRLTRKDITTEAAKKEWPDLLSCAEFQVYPK
ncbi:MAG: hypothetical protein HY221_02290 [Candidatus Sungbacteria bacterium]|uniref:Uncharacterized protein n=1 Tax=Candidatus Sungiibacteriota bacterium TaxID=2750080 RepID=A0A932QYH9_9BACT|nr:hypothetical protein [Candidatus Sungbacteria bacterium]